MKKAALFLLFVLVNSIGLQAQQLNEKFEDTKKGITINYPSNWILSAEEGCEFVLTSTLENDMDRFRESIKLVIKSNDADHNSDSYSKAVHEEFKDSKNYMKVSTTGFVTKQGLAGKKIVYTHSHTGSRLYYSLYYIIQGNVIYNFTCTSTVLKRFFYGPVFDDIIESFSIKEAAQPVALATPKSNTEQTTKPTAATSKPTNKPNPKTEEVQVNDRAPIAVADQPKESSSTPVTPPQKKSSAPVNNGIKPTLELVQPKVHQGGKLLWLEKEITIKGTAKSPNGIFEVLVNGVEAPLGNGNSFSHTQKLAYKDNQITITITDVFGNITEQSFVVERQVRVANVNDTLKRQGHDYALIIVTDNYDNYNHLTNPVNDGETLAKELQNNYGFKTEVVKDATRGHVYEVLREYSKKTYADDDQLLIFFAGHGEYDDVFAEGYIVAKDSKKNDEVKDTFIPHSNLRTIINHVPCKHILLVMDVCFGGTFDQALVSVRGEETDEVDKAKFIQRKLQYGTRRYLTSGGKEYEPDGRPGEHSPFARKCLEALRSNGGQDGILTFGELYSYVEKATPGPRTGEFGNNEPGSDFLFIYKK